MTSDPDVQGNFVHDSQVCPILSTLINATPSSIYDWLYLLVVAIFIFACVISFHFSDHKIDGSVLSRLTLEHISNKLNIQ